MRKTDSEKVNKMDMLEIQRYIRVGSGYIEVDRNYLPDYQGICRRIYIRKNAIQIDYITSGWIDIEEGEDTFYFYYDDLESAVKSAEEYIGKPVSEWVNYNRTYNMWNFPELNENSCKKLWIDLQSHKLKFPKNFNRFSIRTLYSRGVFLNIINPEISDFDFNTDLIEKISESDSDFYKY